METKTKISTQDLNLYYGENHALKDVSLDLYENKITAFIGPSGCGKSTYLKTLNRMNDLVPGVKIEGSVRLTRISMIPRWTPHCSGRRSAWYSSSPIHSP